MDYETVSVFARTWGVVYLILLFVGVCVYAFWPRNRDMFDRAAQTPLDKDEP